MNRAKATKYIAIKLACIEFINKHKYKSQDFTRSRILTFSILFITILRNSVKSLSIVMNELFMDGYIEVPVTASAYTQARKKLKHTAFKELNEGLVEMQYEDPSSLKTWKSFRLLAVDCCKLILPNTKPIAKEFGTIIIKTNNYTSEYACAAFECCYDVLNNLSISGLLTNGNIYEPELAANLLDQVKKTDVLIYDRGYCSFKFPATLIHKGLNFIIRCNSNSFKAFEPFFNGELTDEIVTLDIPLKRYKEIIEFDLPLSITVRIVAVKLVTGEIEVLMTSLMDKNITPADFRTLYGLRWSIETFFYILKGRLALENFTGLTVESIKQDFWSTILISNYETIVTYDLNKNLAQVGPTPKKINKAVSFNIIKNQAFEILFNNKLDPEEQLNKLEKIFTAAAIPDRDDRYSKRKPPSITRSCNYLRRKKKQVY